MDKRRDIGEVIKGRLSQVEKSPKNLSWNQIEYQLNKKKKKHDFFVLKKRYVFAIVIVVIIISINGYYNYYNNNSIDTRFDFNKTNFTELDNNDKCDSIFENLKQTNGIYNKLLISKKANPKISYSKTKGLNKLASSSYSFNDEEKNINISAIDSFVIKRASKKINLLRKDEDFSLPVEQKNNFLKERELTKNSEKEIKDTLINVFQTKEELTEKPKNKNLAISINIAPSVLYTNNTNESLISDRIIANNKSNEVSLNYGASLSYSLNNSISIRLGYERVSVKFKEKNISNESIINSVSSLGLSLSEDIQNEFTNSEFSDLTQQISYHKASLAMLYSIYNKKIRTSISGGIGFLYQEKNQLNIETNNRVLKLGENNNIIDNNISLQTGLHLSYPVFRKVHFFMEPQLEYYLFANDNLDNTNFNSLIFNFKTGVIFKLNE